MLVLVIRSALRDSFFWGIFTMSYKHISVPESGDMIVVNADNSLSVPDNPIIPYIEGDGIGIDISPVMIAVVDAAVAKAYDNARQISWMEIYTGEKAAELYDGDWFPEETLDAIKTYSVAIKGPLTTPVGGGFRSRLMWRCARSWIFTPACALCVGSKAYLRRSRIRAIAIW